MSQAASSLALLLIVPLALAGVAFNGPGGFLPLLFTRHARWRYRRFRKGGVRGRQKSGRAGKVLSHMVKRADRYRCVYCGERNRKLLQTDHIVPWIMGGLTCLWNCATLCRTCNVIKSCYWVSPSGHVYYRGSRRPPARAAEILTAELAARHSPWRWLRAYGLLPAW
jgi:5-methylcytosine-specific restriction endonuclease McrA